MVHTVGDVSDSGTEVFYHMKLASEERRRRVMRACYVCYQRCSPAGIVFVAAQKRGRTLLEVGCCPSTAPFPCSTVPFSLFAVLCWSIISCSD